jgi:V8-like Glu-specific endopeptidase
VIGLNKARNRIKHRTNTLAGSSGSPCFDRYWNLIALHHYGDPGYVAKPAFNQAVPIRAIQARLGARGHAGLLGGESN